MYPVVVEQAPNVVTVATAEGDEVGQVCLNPAPDPTLIHLGIVTAVGRAVPGPPQRWNRSTPGLHQGVAVASGLHLSLKPPSETPLSSQRDHRCGVSRRRR